MNTLIITTGDKLELLQRWSPTRAFPVGDAPFDMLILDGVEVAPRLQPALEWAEVAIGDSLASSSLFNSITVPCVGMGNQLHQLSLRQGDVWYKLGVPSWRLAPRKRFVWGLFNQHGLHRAASEQGMEWALEPLARYLRAVNFVGPMGVWVTRRRFSNFVVAIDYDKAYREWVSTDPDLHHTVKELINA